ncbi:MAG TPA: HAMP domain-containing sensor histidine kinase, partial [Candidatus Nitrosocosmicus sp.]
KEKDLQKANEELTDTNKIKSEFISMMSHELRTPLVPIKGYTEMLMRPNLLGGLNEKQTKAIQIIYRNIKKQEALVEDMLDCTKLELGQLRLSKKMVAPSDLFDNIVNDSKSMIDSRQISLILELESKNPIYCDEKRIEQVILNFVKNSVDFVPKIGGKILLRVEEEILGKEHCRDSKEYKTNINDIEGVPNKMIFTVKDNGEGIPADKINNLFKKFYQIDTSATRKHSGTGLGLVICKGIVEAHGGRIWIDENYHGGFGIRFSIPMINSDNIDNSL